MGIFILVINTFFFFFNIHKGYWSLNIQLSLLEALLLLLLLFFKLYLKALNFFNFYLYIYFLAVLGLRFCTRAFSSCGKRGPLFIAVRGPLTVAASLCCGAQAPDTQAQ